MEDGGRPHTCYAFPIDWPGLTQCQADLRRVASTTATPVELVHAPGDTEADTSACGVAGGAAPTPWMGCLPLAPTASGSRPVTARAQGAFAPLVCLLRLLYAVHVQVEAVHAECLSFTMGGLDADVG